MSSICFKIWSHGLVVWDKGQVPKRQIQYMLIVFFGGEEGVGYFSVTRATTLSLYLSTLCWRPLRTRTPQQLQTG